MNTWSRALLAVGLAACATLASGAIDTTSTVTYPNIMGCESGCPVAAIGWPVAYVVDYPGISPVGSASLVGGLLGLDTFQPAELIITFAFWLVISAAVVWAWRRKARKA